MPRKSSTRGRQATSRRITANSCVPLPSTLTHDVRSISRYIDRRVLSARIDRTDAPKPERRTRSSPFHATAHPLFVATQYIVQLLFLFTPSMAWRTHCSAKRRTRSGPFRATAITLPSTLAWTALKPGKTHTIRSISRHRNAFALYAISRYSKRRCPRRSRGLHGSPERRTRSGPFRAIDRRGAFALLRTRLARGTSHFATKACRRV